MEKEFITKKLDKLYRNIEGIYTESFDEGYWSNISKGRLEDLLIHLEQKSTRDVIREKLPSMESYIFNSARAKGLELLNIQSNHIGIDYGCMWGNLLVKAAKQCTLMVGVDKTRGSLLFLHKRLQEEKLDNCFLINSNLQKNIDLKNVFDFAIVNGVLEWIPIRDEIEIEDAFLKKKIRFVKPEKNPKLIQSEFLEMVCENLKKNGELYLAIENRYDYQYFFWKKDPHSNAFFTAFLPRKISNVISNILYGKPYESFIYSHRGLEKLLKKAGFRSLKKYAVFPNYKYPRIILPFQDVAEQKYNSIYKINPTQNIFKNLFRKIRCNMDNLFFNRLKFLGLAPSFIIIAKK